MLACCSCLESKSCLEIFLAPTDIIFVVKVCIEGEFGLCHCYPLIHPDSAAQLYYVHHIH